MSKKQRQDSIHHLNNRLSSPQVTVCALGGLLGQSAPPEIRQRALSDTLAFTEDGGRPGCRSGQVQTLMLQRRERGRRALMSPSVVTAAPPRPTHPV